MIIDEIKKANVQAIKDKDATARSIYSVIINKSMQETIKKRATNETLTDADMVAIIQKTIKELSEEADNYKKVGNDAEYNNITVQKGMIEKYLPQMMSEKEIADIISKMEDKSIPTVMKYFKANYAGKCEMRLVQEVLKKI